MKKTASIVKNGHFRQYCRVVREYTAYLWLRMVGEDTQMANISSGIYRLNCLSFRRQLIPGAHWKWLKSSRRILACSEFRVFCWNSKALRGTSTAQTWDIKADPSKRYYRWDIPWIWGPQKTGVEDVFAAETSGADIWVFFGSGRSRKCREKVSQNGPASHKAVVVIQSVEGLSRGGSCIIDCCRLESHFSWFWGESRRPLSRSTSRAIFQQKIVILAPVHCHPLGPW